MKLNDLREALLSRADVADWRISESSEKGSECYLVGDRPDLARSVEKRDIQATVFVDAGSEGARTRGSATVSIHPTMGPSEIGAVLDRAVFAASKSRNPWYPLAGPKPATVSVPGGGFEGRAPEAWTGELLEALYAGARTASAAAGKVNSLELFLGRVERRVLSSSGVDASWSLWSGTVELTVEAEGPSGGVELTDWLHFSEPDVRRLGTDLGRRLASVGDRAAAQPTPSLSGLPLILAGKEAEAVLRWFFDNLDAARVYARSSPFCVGAPLHGEEARAGDYDPLELWAEPILPGAPGSAPYDAEGFPLARRRCASGGIASSLHGQSRYAHYLGLEPVGSFSLLSVGPGSVPAARMRAEAGLEVAYFSDFSVDPDSGDFGGEIRLAYWNDGARRLPITGGSVTGSLIENRALLRLASEIADGDSMRGPAAILLPRVSVTGAV